ncbi:tenascin-like protein [Achlya hypogyna]|uniref:Tenascin-like protein n=1 Tax=Achlya hypogyna TaxID=1202772 RepID=A0A1V9Y4T5_ACHHY|nr:tenascin-like protein [Achlya hypogyna]
MRWGGVLILATCAQASLCPKDCSGHGLCLFPGLCQCSKSYSGVDCSLIKCPKGNAWADYPTAVDNAHNLAVCSNMGTCDSATGLCNCVAGFTGAACDRMTCSCNARGVCLSMAQYATTKDPGLGTIHPYSTNWDADKIYGCGCDPPYTGYACTEFMCPTGDDPLTGTIQDPNGVQYNEKQVVTCQATGGSFVLAFLGFTTTPILATDSAATMQAKLLALPSIHGIAVSFSGITQQACTILGNAITIEFTQDFGNLPSLIGNGALLTLSTAGVSPRLTVVTTVEGTKENVYCSNRGLCDRTSGVCTCFTNYFSSDGNGNVGTRGDCGAVVAAITQCPGSVLACSGHGVCQGPPTYACVCASGFQGGDCSEQLCPMGNAWFDYPFAPNAAHDLVECSNAGTCDRSKGVCVCDPRFTGAACNRMVCPNSCSGHGTCLTMQNLAPLATTNGDPQSFTYGSTPNNYAVGMTHFAILTSAKTWDFGQVQGCACNPGWEGYDCSRMSCPTGDDPIAIKDPAGIRKVNAVQTIVCTATAGTFTIGFRGGYTSALPFTISSATLSAVLNAIPSFGEVNVTVTYTSGTSACTANGANTITIKFLSMFGVLPSIKYTLNGVTSIAVFNDGTGGSVVGTKTNAVCSGRGNCDYAKGLCVCATGFTSSDGYGNPGSRGDCGYMEPIYLNSAGQYANSAH